MTKLLKKLVSNKGVLVGNLLCLVMGILMLSLPGLRLFSKLFGATLVLMSIISLAGKLTRWTWPERIYPIWGTLTLILGMISFIFKL